jgi:hypothetical protein
MTNDAGWRAEVSCFVLRHFFIIRHSCFVILVHVSLARRRFVRAWFDRDAAGRSPKHDSLSAAIEFAAQMILIHARRFEGQAGFDPARAGRSVNIHRRRRRQGQVDASARTFQIDFVSRVSGNGSDNRTAAGFSRDSPGDLFQDELTTARFYIGVAKKIAHRDGAAAGFGHARTLQLREFQATAAAIDAQLPGKLTYCHASPAAI